MRLPPALTGILIILTAVLQLQDTSDMEKPHRHTNRLINATSPYLLQHAHNPVDWYEWGEEALTRAKEEDKPILVSIGYSSCHWCHVMERESFEDEKIASVMNKRFICIKVDREERPDIDQVYMEAVQAMGLNGGWPLNVFLTPDQKPFYGGTYYPPASWDKLLRDIDRTFRTRRDELETSATQLTQHLAQSDLQRFKTDTTASELRHDVSEISAKLQPAFDTTWGGMNRAPKFVMPSLWMLLLRCHHLSGNDALLQQVGLTLKKVAMGGIHDQVGGGFARYSVDGEWFAPHFEKMLYDNAQLMSLYAEAYAITGDEEYANVVSGIFDWLTREMTHPQGGFYSALDADSEGEEGKYYVWTKAEIDQHLGDHAQIVGDYYSVTPEGNWEKGRNILMRLKPDDEFLSGKDITPTEWNAILKEAKTKLLRAREKRIKPGLDDKIITAWNGLMITGLTDAYRALGDPQYLDAAEKCIHFLEENLCEGTTLHRSFKGKASTAKGFLDDYAFMIQAYLNLYEVTFDETYLARAKDLLTRVMEDFYDDGEKFFFYTSHDGEALISRKKEIFDNVIPSSNSAMARNLMRLGLIYDKPEWLTLSESMTSTLSELARREPNYMSNWGISLLEDKTPTAEVVFVGDTADDLRKQFQAAFHPFSICLGAGSPTLADESPIPLLEGKTTVGGQSTIYVCFNKTCKLPVHTVAEATEQVKAR